MLVSPRTSDTRPYPGNRYRGSISRPYNHGSVRGTPLTTNTIGSGLPLAPILPSGFLNMWTVASNFIRFSAATYSIQSYT